MKICKKKKNACCLLYGIWTREQTSMVANPPESFKNALIWSAWCHSDNLERALPGRRTKLATGTVCTEIPNEIRKTSVYTFTPQVSPRFFFFSQGGPPRTMGSAKPRDCAPVHCQLLGCKSDSNGLTKAPFQGGSRKTQRRTTILDQAKMKSKTKPKWNVYPSQLFLFDPGIIHRVGIDHYTLIKWNSGQNRSQKIGGATMGQSSDYPPRCHS